MVVVNFLSSIYNIPIPGLTPSSSSAPPGSTSLPSSHPPPNNLYDPDGQPQSIFPSSTRLRRGWFGVAAEGTGRNRPGGNRLPREGFGGIIPGGGLGGLVGGNGGEAWDDGSPVQIYYELHGAPVTFPSASGISTSKEKAGGDIEDEKDIRKVVFLMGLGNTCFAWNRQIRYFADRVVETLDGSAGDEKGKKKKRYTILVLDNRGVGLSDSPQCWYKTSGMATDVVELLDHLGWTRERSLHVVGISLGGMIAQELALQIPHRLISLNLTSTTPGSRLEIPPLPSLKLFGSLLFGPARSPEEQCRMVIETLFPKEWLDEDEEFEILGEDGIGERGWRKRRERVEEEYLRRYHITRPQTETGRTAQTSAALGHLLSPERQAEISRLIPKVGIIYGDKDGVVKPEKSRELARGIQGSELVCIEGGGHALPVQFEQRYNNFLEHIFEGGETRVSQGFNPIPNFTMTTTNSTSVQPPSLTTSNAPAAPAGGGLSGVPPYANVGAGSTGGNDNPSNAAPPYVNANANGNVPVYVSAAAVTGGTGEKSGAGGEKDLDLD